MDNSNTIVETSTSTVAIESPSLRETDHGFTSATTEAALRLTRSLGRAAAQRDRAKLEVDAAKELLHAAKADLKEAERGLATAQESINHVVGLLIGCAMGQLPLLTDEPLEQGTLPEGVASADGVALVDHGGSLPISTLLEFGITQHKLDQFGASKYGDTTLTIGDLERLITDTRGYFWKDVKGWGEKFATGEGEKDWPQIHLRFRSQFPLPTETHTGPRKCLSCSVVYQGHTRCQKCKSSAWEPATPPNQSPESIACPPGL